MAPLLHSLVRFHRPQTIVEIGYGYTTPFLAQGLADNALNSAAESHYGSGGNIAEVLHKPWYEDNNIDVGMNVSTTESRLVSIDDDSQRGNDAESKAYLQSVENVLKELNLNELVTIKSKLPLSKAHRHFKLDSIDMIWNDATWNPDFMKKWWPRLKSDGGLLLLHNPIGNADDGERWCVASPTRTLKLAVPDANFEFVTLLEPHKAYQGSVAVFRKLDSRRAPKRYGSVWGMDRADFRARKLSQYQNIQEALGRVDRFLSRDSA